MSDIDGSLDLLAALVLEDGRRWGEAAERFQWDDARAVLSAEPPYSYLTRPRGGSKTTDLAGLLLAAMTCQLPPASRCYAIAADKDQGRLILDAVEGFVRRSPVLAGLFDCQTWRVTHRSKGATLEVLAADAPGSWGLRPDFVVADELAQWPETPASERLWEAMSSSVAKLPGARLCAITTAGDPSHFAHGILEHALADPLWFVDEVAGPPPWADPARIAEQKRRLPDSAYRRLFLNEWTEADDRLVSDDDLAACVRLDGPLAPVPGVRYVIGLDLGLKNDRTVAAVCHRSNGVVLDRLAVWQGSRKTPVDLAAVEAWVLEAHRTYSGATVVFDPWQAVQMTQSLRNRGVRVVEFTFSSASVGRLAMTLLRHLRDRALSLPDDPDLLDELAHVRLREPSPGVYRIDHDPGRHDDRVIALALASQQLLEADPRPDPGRFIAELTSSNHALVRTSPGWRI